MINFDCFNLVLIWLNLLQIDTNYFCLHQIQSNDTIQLYKFNQIKIKIFLRRF